MLAAAGLRAATPVNLKMPLWYEAVCECLRAVYWCEKWYFRSSEGLHLNGQEGCLLLSN